MLGRTGKQGGGRAERRRRTRDKGKERAAAAGGAGASSSAGAELAPEDVAPTAAAGPTRFEALLESRWVLPAAVLVGLLLRLAHGFALSRTPFFDHLGLDCEVYDEWAQRIAAGDWMGTRIFYQDPLYPYFLGVLYAVFGRSLWLVYLLQVGFGLATCWLTAVLGRRLFGRAAGNLAGWMAALFAPSIFYELQVEKTFLSVFLVAAFLVTFLDRRPRMRLASGLLLALACLARANLIVFLPLAALLLAFEKCGGDDAADSLAVGERERAAGGAAFDLARLPDAWGLRQAAAFALGAALVLGPVALRNHHVEGQWVLTTSQAGQNFYIGNNPLNTTGSYIVPPSIRPDPHFEEMDFRAEAERQAGRKLAPSQVSAWWWDAAWKHIASNPTFAQMMFQRKVLVFWNDYEVPDNLNMDVFRRFSWVMAAPLPGVGILAALALLGVLASLRRNAEARVLAGFVLVYCATVVAFFVFSRYRIQVVPVLAVFAAWAVVWLVREVSAAAWPRAVAGAAAVGLGAMFCFQPLPWMDRDKAIAISLNNLGAIYMDMGDTVRAMATYEEAVRLKPEGVVGAIRILGDWRRRSGDYAGAESYMKQVVALRPDSRMGWNALASLYQERAAAGEAVAADDLVGALLSAGRADEANAAAAAAAAEGRPVSAALRARLGQGR